MLLMADDNSCRKPKPAIKSTADGIAAKGKSMAAIIKIHKYNKLNRWKSNNTINLIVVYMD